MAHSLRISLKFLREKNRVDIDNDDLVNLDSFLNALCSIEGREISQIDAYEAAAADPHLKIIKNCAYRCIKRMMIQKISLWLMNCGTK